MSRIRPSISAVTMVVALALAMAACGSSETPGQPTESAEASATSRPSPSEAAEPSEVTEPSEGADASETVQPSETAASSEAAMPTVRMVAFAFDTAVLTVPVGTTVRFENADSAPHTVTHGETGVPASDPIVDVQVGPGGARNVTFDQPGTYSITCTIHPSMNMTVMVEG